MDFPPAKFLVAHAVLQPANLAPRDPAADEQFISAVREQFPNVISRQILPAEAPPQVPHLTLASSSSQLAVSQAQVDFEVRFYGDFLDDLTLGLNYVDTKLRAVLAGFEASGKSVSLIGLIATLHFSLKDSDLQPVEHVLQTHVRTEADLSEVQDAQAKIAVRVASKYFVNLTLGNYESRSFMRPVMPGMGPIRIRPWEGHVDDLGLELQVDINNNLEARENKQDPIVTDEGISSVLSLLRHVAENVGPRWAETGELATSDLKTPSQA